MSTDHRTTVQLPNDSGSVSFYEATELERLDFGEKNPIQLNSNNAALFQHLQDHGFIKGPTLTAGIIQQLGLYRQHKVAARARHAALIARPRPDAWHQRCWLSFQQWYYRVPNLPSSKEQMLTQLQKEVQNLQAEERGIALNDPKAQALFCMKVYQRVQNTLTKHQSYCVTEHQGLGQTHRTLVAVEDFISRYQFPDQVISTSDQDPLHFRQEHQTGYVPPSAGNAFSEHTYRLEDHLPVDDATGYDFLLCLQHFYNLHPVRGVENPIQPSAYQASTAFRRNHLPKIFSRMQKSPRYTAAALLLTTALALPGYLLLDPMGIHFLIENAGFTGYAAQTVAIALTLGISLWIARTAINGALYLHRKRQPAPPPKRLSLPETALRIGEHVAIHHEHNNRFRNNPIARLWQGISVFFRWFNLHGNEYPITMTAYASVYGIVAADLGATQALLPNSLHHMATTAAAGLMSPKEGAVINAMATAFFSGKITLLLSDTVQNRQDCWIMRGGRLVLRRPIDAAAFAVAATIFVELEDGVQLIRDTFGNWTGPDEALSTYKPILLALDAFSNPSHSLLGSTYQCLYNFVTMFRSWTTFKAGMRDLERISIDGLFALLRFPVRLVLYPISRVLVKALTLLSARLVNTLLYLTPGFRAQRRKDVVHAIFNVEGRYNALATLGIQADSRWRVIKKNTRWYHVLILGALMVGFNLELADLFGLETSLLLLLCLSLHVLGTLMHGYGAASGWRANFHHGFALTVGLGAAIGAVCFPDQVGLMVLGLVMALGMLHIPHLHYALKQLNPESIPPARTPGPSAADLLKGKPGAKPAKKPAQNPKAKAEAKDDADETPTADASTGAVVKH